MLNSSLFISVEAKSHGVRLVEESRSLAAHLALEHRYRESRPVQESFLTFQNVGAAQIVPSPEVYEKARSRKGIVGAFERTCRRWKLDSDGQMILLGYRPTDVTGRCVLAGLWIPSSQDFEDRVGYVVSIGLALDALFGQAVDAEIGWLRQPRARLGGKSALEYMLEGHMANLFVIAKMVTHERGL